MTDKQEVNEVVDKQLKEKAIDIKGKDYVMVKDRLIYFNEIYPNGSIRTRIISEIGSGTYVVEAKVVPDHKNIERYFSGHSQAIVGDGMVNKTSALENAETSAVGRALALMGIGVLDSVASADEIVKAGADKEDLDDMQVLQKELGCSRCGGPMVLNPKTDKMFCKDKCWLKQ